MGIFCTSSVPEIKTNFVIILSMPNLNPLKYCFHGKHSKPRAQFRILPGVNNTSAVCAECYAKIVAKTEQKAPISRP